VVAEVDPIGELGRGFTGYVNGVARAAGFAYAMGLHFQDQDLPGAAELRRQCMQDGALLRGLIVPHRN
jgi:hypothetical protein